MINATIAKLYYFSENTNSVLAFETLSGELLVHQRDESLVMNFPLNKPEVQVQTLKYRSPRKYLDTLTTSKLQLNSLGTLPIIFVSEKQHSTISEPRNKILRCILDKTTNLLI